MFQVTALRPNTSIRTVTTAHLTQTMALLELTAAELNQKIEAELSNNPALEVRESKRCPSCRRPLPGAAPCPRCSAPKSLSPDEPIVFVSPRDDFRLPAKSAHAEMPDEDRSQALEDLPTFVLRQIAPDLEVEERRLAAHILTSLDDDGLLETPILEIARYHHVLPSKVEKVLKLIQRAEPLGVGSPSPQAALIVQLEVLAETCSVPALAAQAVRQGLDLLSRHQYSELARLLGTSPHQAQQIGLFIGENLNPYPGRAYWGDVHQGNAETPSVYTNPDVILSTLEGRPDSPIVVEVVSPFSGMLYVSREFRKYAGQASEEKADEWKKCLERADLLVKCLQQRTHTIVRLMRRIAGLQREFILHGDACLQPVTRASLAQELEVHESTISRAVANKTVQLPSGHIVPLSKFFDRSLHVRTALKEIILNETRPLSDSQIARLLQKQGHDVARRTVAKYRAMEGILPSFMRQAASS